MIERARRRFAREQRLRRSARFLHVIGRFAHDGLLLVNYEVPRHAASLHIDDVLWAGQLEPRVLELLPALIVKRPSMFRDLRALPRGKVPALLKSFRFTPEDQRLLAHLAAELRISETEVIRRALRAFVT